jgi:hypothetical protein
MSSSRIPPVHLEAAEHSTFECAIADARRNSTALNQAPRPRHCWRTVTLDRPSLNTGDSASTNSSFTSITTPARLAPQNPPTQLTMTGNQDNSRCNSWT